MTSCDMDRTEGRKKGQRGSSGEGWSINTRLWMSGRDEVATSVK